MTAPRLEIELDKIQHNTRVLVERLGARGISVTGVTKGTLGSPEIAGSFLQSGVSGLGDSRIENIEALRHAGIRAPITLIRSPMLSQVKRVVTHADVSFNTELDVISELSLAAQRAGRTHGIVLMVELGDLREGILPRDLETTVRGALRCPGIALRGIGTNLACQSGVVPDTEKMSELGRLVASIEATFGIAIDFVSGGNSANLEWALGDCALGDNGAGRINDLRLGESILLGRETLHRRPIDELYSDAFTLVAEVIESKLKPSQPWGKIAQAAFGIKPRVADRGDISRTVVALGHQDADPDGLCPPPGMKILGASSDHLVIDSGNHRLAVGTEIGFQPNYSALVRAMTSPFVAKTIGTQSGRETPFPGSAVDRETERFGFLAGSL